jgi:hypothetical protein
VYAWGGDFIRRFYKIDIDLVSIQKSLIQTPENQAKLKDSEGWYRISFRIDKDYREVQLTWYWINEARNMPQILNQVSQPEFRVQADPNHRHAIEIQMGQLRRGLHEINLRGLPFDNDRFNNFDKRKYRYDGVSLTEY